MNHPPFSRRSTSSSELPRFELPGEASAPDASDAAMTAQRPALRRRPRVRKRADSRVPADSTDEVALDQILLEAYIEPPAPPPPPPAPAPTARVPAAQLPEQLVAIDALLERTEPSPPSVAPVALQAPQQTIGVHDATQGRGGRVAVALMLALVFASAAAASFTILAKPETLGRVREGITSRLAPRPGARAEGVAYPQAAAAVTSPPQASQAAGGHRPEVAPPAGPSAEAPVPTLSVEALPKPAVESDSTLVTLPASSRGHRVFVDGALTPAESATIKTRCGRHTIKIGSSGTARAVDLPCGGELMVR